jgi:hypothetical protein
MEWRFRMAGAFHGAALDITNLRQTYTGSNGYFSKAVRKKMFYPVIKQAMRVRGNSTCNDPSVVLQRHGIGRYEAFLA